MYKNILILPDGTELLSGAGTSNAIKSVKLSEMVNNGTDMMIGSCCCDMFEATFFAPGGALSISSGDEVTLYKESTTGERLKMGVFTVEAQTRPSANTMKIIGYDRVAKLDKDLTAWVNSLEGWPYSVNNFAAMTCEACGLTFVHADGIPNADYPIKKWSKNGVTGRQIMRWLGEIVCRFVHADPDGNICFSWYKDSGKTLTPAGSTYFFAGSFSYENYQVAPVDIVQLRLADGNSGAVWPAAEDGDNAYIITGNAILNAYITDDLIPYLEAIQAELAGMTYTPCEISGPIDPFVRAGSILTATDRNGKQITAYVMEKTTAGQRDTYKCTGNPRRDSSSSIYNKTEGEKREETAIGAVSTLTQEDIFNRLTDYGRIQGLYVLDGKWYINAEVAKIINLIAEKVSSSLGTSTMQINGSELKLLWGQNETFSLWNIVGKDENGQEIGAEPILFFDSYDNGVHKNSAELSSTHLKLGGTSVMPVFYLSAGSGLPKLWLNGEMTGKTLSWKDNGDGTYSLIGS